MTTIVLDLRTKTFAADTRGTKGALKTRLTKLKPLPNGGFFAGCGSHSICLQVCDWVAAGSDPKNRPSINPESDSFEAIIVNADGTAHCLEHRLILIPVEDDYIAIGSGADFAMGAMAAGKSVLEAIEIAAQLDAFTSGPFHIVHLDELEPAPAPVDKPTSKRRSRRKTVNLT